MQAPPVPSPWGVASRSTSSQKGESPSPTDRMASISGSYSSTPQNSSQLHYLLLALLVLCATLIASTSAAESSQLLTRLQADRRRNPPIMALLNDEGELIGTAKRAEPWMSILASNIFKEGNVNANMNYRGLRG